MTDRTLPPKCPSCGGRLVIAKLECPSCNAEVRGDFDPCPVCLLPGEQRRLFDLFLAARGNLKQVQRELGVSYPTTRQRIEEMFRHLERGGPEVDPKEILARVRAGELSVAEAERLLSGGEGS